MSKKAVESVMNVVIVSILLLIVLVVLISIFTKQTNKNVAALNDCVNKGYSCDYTSETCNTAGGTQMNFLTCTDKTKTCCKVD